MLIGSRQRIKTLQTVPLLAINGVPVRQVSHTKSLGTYIDENLSWNVHVEKLCKKVASGISALKRIRPFASPTTMELIYNCLVQPYFDYCSVVWDSCGSTLAEKLQKLQNRAARVLTFSTYDTVVPTPITCLKYLVGKISHHNVKLLKLLWCINH